MTKLKPFNPTKPPLLWHATLSIGLALLVSVGSLSHAQAKETQNGGSIRYVTDSLQVPLRRGPGYKFKIERMLRSGAVVRVLEVSPKGWMRVQYKTKNKTYEGWMPTVLLQNQPIAKIKLAQALEKNNALEAENNQLKQELQALKTRYETVEQQLKQVQQKKFQLDKAYQELEHTSKNAVTLTKENTALKQTLKQAQTQLTLYKEQLNEAEDTVKRQWFLTGAGVLFLGIILGRLFRLPQRKKKWDTL